MITLWLQSLTAMIDMDITQSSGARQHAEATRIEHSLHLAEAGLLAHLSSLRRGSRTLYEQAAMRCEHM